MKIEAYLICWNEEEILPFVIKHYQKLCDKITIFDNFSADRSREIAESMGCDVRMFGEPGKLNDQYYLDIKNNCWKGSDADYVIVCDADEVLHITHDEVLYSMMGKYSSNQLINFWDHWKSHGVTIFKTQGWQITSDAMPNEDITEITTGYAFDNYSKNIIFDPKRIKEINFNPGAHRINPIGEIVWSEETLYVLHYRQIGGVNRLIKRYNEYKKRMSMFNRKNGYGIHYLQRPEQIRASWKRDMLKSKPLV